MVDSLWKVGKDSKLFEGSEKHLQYHINASYRNAGISERNYWKRQKWTRDEEKTLDNG